MTKELAQLHELIDILPKIEGELAITSDGSGQNLHWSFTEGGPVENITVKDIEAIETVRNVRVI